jgi:GNAT superfamily N-acetyltransferase
MIDIREYHSSDLEDLAQLMGDLGYPTSPEVMSQRMALFEANSSYKTFVATWDNKVVGMLGVNMTMNYESDDLVTHIISLVVGEAFQGKGIGKKLMSFIEAWAIDNGSQVLYLTSGIKEERKRAHEFYKKLGFDITGYRFIKRA